MLKNIGQTLGATIAAIGFSLGWPIWVCNVGLIITAFLAAYEEKKLLSAVEVSVTIATVAFAGTWQYGLAGAVILVLWNTSQWMFPLREKLSKAG